jgi:hypothetical protein
MIAIGELGMTPAARITMKAAGTHAAFDLAAVMAQGDEREDEADVARRDS